MGSLVETAVASDLAVRLSGGCAGAEAGGTATKRSGRIYAALRAATAAVTRAATADTRRAGECAAIALCERPGGDAAALRSLSVESIGS